MTRTVGILAYGSLIGDPGTEIEPVILCRIDCRTPFKVEFARTSESRKGGPTLVPYNNGTEVSAQVLVVDLPLSEATDRLYRRELHKVGERIVYDASRKVALNRVIINTLQDFEEVNKVLYTSIGANIEELTATKLAKLAIASARVLTNGNDGISYLIHAKKAGIRTPLSDEYEAEIKHLTGTASLKEALAELRAKTSP